MDEKKKLSEQELAAIRERPTTPGYWAECQEADNAIFRLLDHIDVMEAERAATLQQVETEAYQAGAAVGEVFKEQTDRIEALEKTIRKVIYGVRGIDLQCEKWVTAELSSVLPGFDKIGGSDSSDQKANGPG